MSPRGVKKHGTYGPPSFVIINVLLHVAIDHPFP